MGRLMPIFLHRRGPGYCIYCLTSSSVDIPPAEAEANYYRQLETAAAELAST